MDKEYLELRQELESEAEGPIVNQAVVSTRKGTTVSDVPDGLFGLMAFSDSVLIYKHYPQNSWISMLTRGNSRNLESKPITLIIPIRNIESLDRFAETSFLRKLFINPDPVYSITFTDNRNLKQTLVLNIGYSAGGEKELYRMLSQCLADAD